MRSQTEINEWAGLFGALEAVRKRLEREGTYDSIRQHNIGDQRDIVDLAIQTDRETDPEKHTGD